MTPQYLPPGASACCVYVIVVTYNAESYYQQCFESLALSGVKANVIVVDNASSDGFLERAISEFPEIEFVKCNTNHGFGEGNNVGLRIARERGATHFLLLNQDATIEVNTIEALLLASEHEPRFDVLSPMQLNGEGEGLEHFFSRFAAPEYCPDLYSDACLGKLRDSPYEVSFVQAACWLLTRKCVETVGGFNPLFFMYGEDNDYLHRVVFHGMRAGIVAGARIKHSHVARTSTPFNLDPDIVTKRQLLIDLCDPHAATSPRTALREFRRGLAVSVIRCQPRATKDYLRRLRVLKPLAEAIAGAKALTATRGSTFL